MEIKKNNPQITEKELEGMKQLELSCAAGGSVNWYRTVRTVWSYLVKPKTRTPCHPDAPPDSWVALEEPTHMAALKKPNTKAYPNVHQQWVG